MKKALITGITGQDGSYLAELLLSRNYEVHGIMRRASTFNTDRIDHIYIDPHSPDARFFLHYGDLTDAEQINNIIFNIRPDEIYHLGAQSHVRVSFDMPEYTTNAVATGTTRILEAIRRSRLPIKFYQASSSEMFGGTKAPQSENSLFQPRSPYACSKLYSYWMVKNYREGYNIFASNGILFNHESPRRGETFVTRKITRAAANILCGKEKKLYLGNLDARRDWGFAPEYVEMMWRILQSESPDDYVIGTGESHSVLDFVNEVFNYVGIDIEWKGKGIDRKGIVSSINPSLGSGSLLEVGKPVIEIDPKYFRPTEVEDLIADNSKAKKNLKFIPRIGCKDLARIMVDADLKAMRIDPIGKGEKILKEKFPEKWWKND